VQTGLDYYDLSGGKFDITIAPLSDLWDFKSGDAIVPEEAAIQSALRKVDASAVHVRWDSGSGKDQAEEEAGDMPEMETEPEIKPDPEPEAYPGEEGKAVLYFDNPDTMIDLGALVKGYAADRLSAYLKKEGVTSGLINLGGNVLAIGPKPDGSAWKIGIQKPFDTGIVDTVEVADQSVVSSGVYERCFEKDGKLYHHILDPTTGYPAETGLWGVSIISDSSLTGDALSTTCLLLGIDEASELIRPMDGVRAIFVDDRLHVSG
jgi:thiamine biosynthesis lipoprotein